MRPLAYTDCAPSGSEVSKVNNSALRRNFFRNDKNAGIVQFPRFVYQQEGSCINPRLITLTSITCSMVLRCIDASSTSELRLLEKKYMHSIKMRTKSLNFNFLTKRRSARLRHPSNICKAFYGTFQSTDVSAGGSRHSEESQPRSTAISQHGSPTGFPLLIGRGRRSLLLRTPQMKMRAK